MLFGSVIEITGIPGAGKTTTLEAIADIPDSVRASQILKSVHKGIKLSRLDRLSLFITAIRFWKILRFADSSSSFFSTFAKVVTAPFRSTSSRQQFGENLASEILILLNNIGVRAISARVASIATQKHAIVDELWLQGMIGIWLRLPNDRRTLFWNDHVARRKWNNSIVFVISGATAASRLALDPQRPLIRYAAEDTVPDESISAQLDKLSKLANAVARPELTISSDETNDLVEELLKQRFATIAPNSNIFVASRTRTRRRTAAK